MKLLKKFRFICALFTVIGMSMFSCSKLGEGVDVSPFGTNNSLGEARFKEFNLEKSENVTEKNAVVFESKDEAYKFATDVLLKSLKKHNPEQFNLMMQSLTGKNVTQSTNEDEGALPDNGPRHIDPCTNALMEGNGLRVSLFANMGFHAQTDANGHITSVGTDINGFVVGISNGNSYFNTAGSTYDRSTGTYRVEGSVSINYNFFIEGVGTYYTLPLRGILTIRRSGGCGSSQNSVDFEMTE
jgi:hypothetical protein